MKQVVGCPFTGKLDQALETRIINGLLSATKRKFDAPGITREERRKAMNLEARMAEIKELIGPRLAIYLNSIASRLLEADTKLKWSPFTNNCQNFCDALIDRSLFAPLVKPELYLMSFTCRPAGYVRPIIKSKFDVPRGLTEEFLLRYRFGRHDDADIIDSLQEYWYDWGAFGKHLYQYQDLFPWDCREAFGRYPERCGECNLSKHLWAFPFDSWSIIALHMARDRHHYQPLDGAMALDNQTWIRNRLLVLNAQEKLIRGAVAMARNGTFQQRISWLHEQGDAATDRLKLGGIHRAQPFSHVYDHHGQYKHYFIASWAVLTHDQRVAQYEMLRDGRARLPDLEYAPLLYDGKRIQDILKQAGGGGIDGIGDLGTALDGSSDLSNSFDVSMNDGMMADGFDASTGDAGCASNCGTGCGSVGVRRVAVLEGAAVVVEEVAVAVDAEEEGAAVENR